MATDYKARQGQRPRRRRNGGGSCFFWFLTGALLGALGVAVAWMLEGYEETADTKPVETAQQAETEQAIPRPRFDYHSILPEMEVVVPNDELDKRPPALPPPPGAEPEETAAAPEPAPAPEPQPAGPAAVGGTSYLLQVASFKNPADAERLKAKLALLGMTTSIQQVTINGKDTYHRVRVGPYNGKGAVNKARDKLAGEGLESLTIKLK